MIKSLGKFYNEDLFDNLAREAKIANAKLLRLQGHFGTKESWAGRTLLSRLKSKTVQGLSEKGFVKYNRNLPEEQAFKILRAVQQFNKAETSTVAGVLKSIESVKKSLSISYNITASEADLLFRFMNSEDYNRVNFDEIYSKEVVNIAYEAKEQGKDAQGFIEILRNYIANPNAIDITMIKNLTDFYNKYISNEK